MSESFTALEYAILAHLRSAGHSTIPALAADLLLRLGETQEAISSLVAKGVMQKDGDVYSPSPLALEMPLVQIQKSAAGRLAPGRPAPASMPPPQVDQVFRQARERAQREKATGTV
jgi:hypothetical protein